ncbi:unnamed protein product [Eruca vesicaria subsp. sativa]|uniref:Pentatricopeptide repeat-containing protein n=1 Tax=Eruca vesicaria subsp. sativa TaxID=29727 RepID=A0ABC8LEH2_ERUVS|nr:unnamed protein product [Eruca vesicaria subsp. sativa]
MTSFPVRFDNVDQLLVKFSDADKFPARSGEADEFPGGGIMLLFLRPTRRLCYSSIASTVIASSFHAPAVSNNQEEEPALFKLKSERDPAKLFNLFQANATNHLVFENHFAFEDTVSRLARARRFDFIEKLLENQKTLPQGRHEGFVVRIIMLYGKAGVTNHALDTFYNMDLYGCKRTVKSFNAALKVLTLKPDLRTI